MPSFAAPLKLKITLEDSVAPSVSSGTMLLWAKLELIDVVKALMHPIKRDVVKRQIILPKPTFFTSSLPWCRKVQLFGRVDWLMGACLYLSKQGEPRVIINMSLKIP
ncbi:hypothetical protein [Dulcicalothrix desertica]|uniref:hypothetical protein n=1 Tax=Dulcicalothrix desertica TaxID=32056 RepID=UPI000F8DF6CE|nr:hypothetical protein [Dulcicalothrix desertica]